MLNEEIQDKKGISIDKLKKEKTEQKREIRREMTRNRKKENRKKTEGKRNRLKWSGVLVVRLVTGDFR